jgi:uncharacterized protein (DUF2164 family)
MKNKDRIKLSKEKRADMITAIQRYYLNERDEELGNLAAGLILDFVIDELAPEFYNQGVLDSQKYFSEKVEDLLAIQL